MRFPWVSREMHEAVLAERERVIVAFRVQIAMLEKRLEQPIPVTVTLPKDFAVIQPAVIQRPARKKKLDPSTTLPAAPNFDLADVDENNSETLASLAMQKYGRRAANLWELQQWVRGIKVEIGAARAAKRRARQQEANEPAPKIDELQAGVDLDQVDVDEVPTETLLKIEAAERGED